MSINTARPHRKSARAPASRGAVATQTVNGFGVLRSVLERARLDAGCSLSDLTALSAVLRAMEKGASLHSSHERGRQLWRLSTGPFVSQEIANLVINNPCVVGVGERCFPTTPVNMEVLQ
jgi:hypothetical protein